MSDIFLQVEKLQQAALEYMKDDRVADTIGKLSGKGGLTNAQTNTLRGINHRGTGSPISVPQDNQGIIFFTRPEMNLSYNNVFNDRVLTPLLNRDRNSLGMAIRCLLDPTLEDRYIVSNLIDNRNPFIPILTNQSISASGWPDMTVDSFVSEEGLFKENYGWVDSYYKTYQAFDLSTNFNNQPGHPIIFMMTVWLAYMANVYTGVMSPHFSKIYRNEIDYNTSIFRLILDPKREHVIHIAKCSAAYPTVNPTGALFNFNSQTPLVADVNEVSLSWKCFGVEYDDPILLLEFNGAVYKRNPGMGSQASREALYHKLTKKEELLYNYYGLPWINIENNHRLEWWVTKEQYRILQSNRY